VLCQVELVLHFVAGCQIGVVNTGTVAHAWRIYVRIDGTVGRVAARVAGAIAGSVSLRTLLDRRLPEKIAPSVTLSRHHADGVVPGQFPVRMGFKRCRW
jgi:hypothetical protein